MNILVLENDREQAEYISNGLSELGHSVYVVDNGLEALKLLVKDGRFDVAVLDRLVPGLDGLSVVRQARQAGSQTPLMFLTALASVEDRVTGLKCGADDYLTKPFAFAELAARIEALGRRPSTIVTSDCLTFSDIEMNLSRRTVMRGGRTIDLQPREFRILEQLMRSPDRVVTRTLLLDLVWNLGFDPHTNIVESHMSRLRTKLNHGFDHDVIRTVRGAGYILCQPGH